VPATMQRSGNTGSMDPDRLAQSGQEARAPTPGWDGDADEVHRRACVWVCVGVLRAAAARQVLRIDHWGHGPSLSIKMASRNSCADTWDRGPADHRLRHLHIASTALVSSLSGFGLRSPGVRRGSICVVQASLCSILMSEELRQFPASYRWRAPALHTGRCAPMQADIDTSGETCA